jgi:hypothetical protein
MPKICLRIPAAIQAESRRTYRQGFDVIEDISNDNGKKLSGSEHY